MAISICNVKTEYKFNPLGMDEMHPRFSYDFSGDILAQEAWRIIVTDQNNSQVWDSDWQIGGTTSQHTYNGQPFAPFTRYYLTVQAKVQMQDGSEKIISNHRPYFFETGFLGKKWEAKWITSKSFALIGPHKPVARFQRFFACAKDKKIFKARLYITALGLYEASINGKKVTDACFTPGNTNYDKRVQYEAYDVTQLLKQSTSNGIDISLGSGWYSGRIAYNYNADINRKVSLLCELHIQYADSTEEKILSDQSFLEPGLLSIASPYRYSDIYDGEWFDAFKDENWMKENGFVCLPGKENSQNCHAEILDDIDISIDWHSGAYVRRIDTLDPVSIKKTPGGNYLVDFGQNLTGREKLLLRNTHQGSTIVIKHGEMLNKNGSLYIDNMRSAWTTTVIVCGDKKKLEYEPLFTFYGFRYLEISGWTGDFSRENIQAVVLSSDLEQTGDFCCSDSDLNQLFSNIVWGHCDNFLDIPTDCPQRDERLGWTGDTQVFSDVATYNMGCQEFYSKWITDMNTQCGPDGSLPDVVPCPWKFSSNAATGWTDAFLVVPWQMFVKYGDTRLLERNFTNILNHYRLQFSKTTPQKLINCASYKDWLSYEPISGEYIATAYFIGMTALLKKAAVILKRTDAEIKEIDKMHDSAKKAFSKHLLDAEGLPVETCQTASLLALYFDLLDKKAVPTVLKRLTDNISAHDTHLSTGFLGTPLLLPVLSRFGKLDLAYDLLFQKTCPSWMFPQTQGATTTWERWNSYTKKDGFGDVRMNSFNHYAYGAVGAWFYSCICGIQPDDSSLASAGFKHFILAPQPGNKLESAEAQFISQYGVIYSSWSRKDNQLTWCFQVPGNTTASIIPPFKVTEGMEDLLTDSNGNLVALPGEYTLVMNIER